VFGALLLGLLVVGPLGLLGAASLAAILRDREERRLFIGARRHRAYLLWSTRDGWHEFMQNNVVPVLPAGIEPCPRTRRGFARGADREVWRWTRFAHRTPCLVIIEGERVHTVPLRRALEPLSGQARKDARTQAVVRERLAPLLAQAPARPERASGGLLTPAAAPGA
jgi:hypothetical protein